VSQEVFTPEKTATDSAVAQSIEVHSIDFIPERERHGNALRQALFWFIPNLTIFSVSLVLIGPSLGLSLWWTIVAGAAAAIVGGFFVSFHASQGPKLGLPQMIQSRAQFGYRGVIIPTLVVLFNFLVFNVLQTDVLKSGLQSVFGWNPVLIIIGVSFLGALLAIFGQDSLHKAFRILFWCCSRFRFTVPQTTSRPMVAKMRNFRVGLIGRRQSISVATAMPALYVLIPITATRATIARTAVTVPK